MVDDWRGHGSGGAATNRVRTAAGPCSRWRCRFSGLAASPSTAAQRPTSWDSLCKSSDFKDESSASDIQPGGGHRRLAVNCVDEDDSTEEKACGATAPATKLDVRPLRTQYM